MTPTTEAGIDYGFTRDVYMVLGDPQDQTGGPGRCAPISSPSPTGSGAAPMVMALGGVLSLTDRRYRVGAPARAKRAAPPARCPRNEAGCAAR
jgi:cytochrome c-type biogenesis protein CcmF